MQWTLPEDETQACWWVANYGEEDKTQEVKLVCRCLAVMRMELHQARMATSAKLRVEWDRRLEKNAAAVDVLNSNRQLWCAAGGPEPEALTNPTEILVDHCQKTVMVLESMLQKHGPQGGLDSFIQEPLHPHAHLKSIYMWCSTSVRLPMQRRALRILTRP